MPLFGVELGGNTDAHVGSLTLNDDRLIDLTWLLSPVTLKTGDRPDLVMVFPNSQMIIYGLT